MQRKACCLGGRPNNLGIKIMKKLLSILLLALPVTSVADHLDVIEFRLHESCDLASYLAIVKDFNEWGKEYGYQATVLVPLQRATLDTMFWIGRSANAEAFGKAWDSWRDAQTDPDSTPAKIWARFAKCETNLNRSDFYTYK